MFPQKSSDKILSILKKKYPERSVDELELLSFKYLSLAKLIIELWVKEVQQNNRDPP